MGPEEKRTCTLLATMMVVVMELAMILEMVTMKVMMKLGHDGGEGGDGDVFADEYVDKSGGGDDTWVESGAQARA